MTEILLATMMETGTSRVFELKDASRQCIPDKCYYRHEVDYATGTVNAATFSSAPPPGLKSMAGYDVDIETDPTLYSLIDYTMESRVVYPHEAAIASNVTDSGSMGLAP